MGRRKSIVTVPAAEPQPEVRAAGKVLEPGVSTVQIRGVRGRFVFHRLNADGSGAFFGGPLGYGMWRDFHLDRVSRVLKPPKV